MAEVKSLGKSKEDYLEAILVVKQEQGWCREVDIANQLGYSRPSVSIALTKLEEEGYILRMNTGAIELTDPGEEIAAATLAKHLLLKKMLLAVGVEEGTAEEEACSLEHSISQDTYEKIRAYLAKHPLVSEDTPES